jgi:hypothetical protein
MTTPVVCLSLLLLATLPAQQDKLRKALKDEVSSAWIYDDIDAAYEAAKKTGRPLLVSFR